MRVELAREGVERWPAKGKIATSEDRDGTKTHFHTSGASLDVRLYAYRVGSGDCYYTIQWNPPLPLCS